MTPAESPKVSPQAVALGQELSAWPTQPRLDYGAFTANAAALCSLESRDEQLTLLPLLLRDIGKYDLENDPQVRVGIRTVDYPGMTLLLMEYPTDPSDTTGTQTTIHGFDLTNRDATVVGYGVNYYINPLLERTKISSREFGDFVRGLDHDAQQRLLATFPEDVRDKVVTLFDIVTHPQPVILDNVTISPAVRAGLPQDRLLTPRELLPLIIADTEDTVPVGFDPRAINAINIAYFSRPDAFAHGIADFFVTTAPLQQAFAGQIEQVIQGKQAIVIKELATGTRLRYPHLLPHLSSGVTAQVVLSDFTDATMPDDAGLLALGLYPGQFVRESYDLTQPLPLLADAQRVDVMLTTYGFDSVWFPEDRRYIKRDGQWYRSSYRLRVPEKIPADLRQEILGALRGDRTANGLDLNLLN